MTFAESEFRTVVDLNIVTRIWTSSPNWVIQPAAGLIGSYMTTYVGRSESRFCFSSMKTPNY